MRTYIPARYNLIWSKIRCCCYYIFSNRSTTIFRKYMYTHIVVYSVHINSTLKTYTKLQGLIYMSLNFFRHISSLSVEKGKKLPFAEWIAKKKLSKYSLKRITICSFLYVLGIVRIYCDSINIKSNSH